MYDIRISYTRFRALRSPPIPLVPLLQRIFPFIISSVLVFNSFYSTRRFIHLHCAIFGILKPLLLNGSVSPLFHGPFSTTRSHGVSFTPVILQPLQSTESCRPIIICFPSLFCPSSRHGLRLC